MTIEPGPPTPSPTPHFDPTESLGGGPLAIEASAGTGKTFALSALAARLLATGQVTASELLIVTFTRAATGELRSRIRERIRGTADNLRYLLAGTPLHEEDPIAEWLLGPGAGDVAPSVRLANLERAVTEFDAATISTIHGFASQVLAALGVASGDGVDAVLVDDTDLRLDEVCTDLLAVAAIDPRRSPYLPKLDTLKDFTKRCLGAPDLRLVPPAGSVAEPGHLVLTELVAMAVARIKEVRRANGTMSFDDLLERLRHHLASPGRGPLLEALRSRFGVALIDEFQDTDPVQWGIFEALFVGADDGTGSLVFVGDPKQAIYSFRGADVQTYRAAVDHTPGVRRRALTTNWRSDAGYLHALDVLFAGATFGGAAFERVEASERHRDERLTTDDGSALASLDIRCAVDPVFHPKPGKQAAADPVRNGILDDLARRTHRLLTVANVPDPEDGRARRVRPSDIAVLVRTGDQALAVQSALMAAGVPAVLNRGTSVLDGEAAMHLAFLLEALVRPADARRARTYAASWFEPLTVAELAVLDDARLLEIQERLHRWNEVLGSAGVVEFLHSVWVDTAVADRVLARADGDRAVTDLEHLSELLRTAAGEGPVSAPSLLSVLQSLRKANALRAEADADVDITARRVETDAEAVQVMTIWVAKGLEFPIALCPTLYTYPQAGVVDYHDPATGERTIDVSGGTWPDEDEGAHHKTLSATESMEEQKRLLYVALTRAAHHCEVWWSWAAGAGSRTSGMSALARFLFARAADGRIDPVTYESIDDLSRGTSAVVPQHHLAVGVITASLVALSVPPGGGAPVIAVESFGLDPSPVPPWVDPRRAAPDLPLAAATFDRPLDRDASRWSFTGIVSRDTAHRNAWDQTIQDEGADDEQRPPDVGLDEHGDDVAAPGLGTDAGGATVGALAWLPAGASFGTLAHDVLERVDFAAVDLAAEVAGVVAAQQAWRSLDLRRVGDPRPLDDPGAHEDGARLLVEGLTAVIRTPLGPQFGDSRLRDIPTTDRLDELAFDLRLHTGPTRAGAAAAGDEGGRRIATDADIGRVLLEHLPAADLLRPWAENLALSTRGVVLAGHLTGSIDAVIRVRAGDGRAERFVVVDYKTNRLHGHGVDPRPGDYGSTAMVAAMAEHHYGLQALLYLVALHRYLRWRLPGYDPSVHLGGACYLFLRGMTGPEVRIRDGVIDGVCSWVPPTAAVLAVSDLLDGARP